LLQRATDRAVGITRANAKTPRRMIWRMIMFRKFALGLVAAASLSAAALAPTAASAKGFGGGWGGGWHHHHFGHGFGLIGVGVGDACLVSQLVLTPFGYRMRLVNVCY
jgi:hypothetical protein